MEVKEVTFQEHPDFWLGNSVFRNVPTIIQYKDTPILEIGKFAKAGYSAKFAVYHSDGTHIATVKGAQIHRTEAGAKANVTLRYPPNLTICELEGQPILELRREGAAALRGWAELYAPEGVLIKSSGAKLSELVNEYGNIVIGWCQIMDAVFEGHPIGIHITGDGNCRLGIKTMRHAGPADKPPPYESIHPTRKP